MNKLQVSIIMITYNHEKYIAEAIKGVLMQKTDFEIEFIIANDASTDNTHALITQLAIDATNITINYINHSVNIGMMPNFVSVLQQCSGKYIALCEGDDYWTDPLKLQKQVDFMEGNPEYNICFHEVNVYKQEKIILESDTITREVPDITTIQELSKGNFMHTPSVLFRNNFNIPKWFSKTPTGDWTLYMIVVKDKKIKKIPEVMAVYREHSAGIWSGKNRLERMKMTKKTFTLVLKNIPLDPISKSNLKAIIHKINKGIRGKRKTNLNWKKKLKNKLRPFYHCLKRNLKRILISAI